jgi:transcriptional regulator with XRE-family HTH domain
MSLKDNYIKLTKKFGGTHYLINKGLTQSIVNSIMRGSDISFSKANKVAKVLGVTMEELLTGNYEEKKVYTPEQQKYIDKLIDILNSNDEHKKITITTMLDNLKRDTWEKDSKKSTHHDTHIKKQKAG